MPKITITVADKDINFNIESDDFNQYINEQMPTDKVGPAYNFLSRTVLEEDREKFKSIALSGGKPNGFIVMQMAGVTAEEFGGGVSISLKKPKASPIE
jgi:hypothetical protein